MTEIACKVSYQCGTKGLLSRAHNVRGYDRDLWNKDGHIDYDRTRFNITLLDKPPDLEWFKENGFKEKIAEYNAAPSQKKNNAKRKKDCKKRNVRKAEIENAIMRKTVSYIFDKKIMNGIVSRVL